MSAAYLSVDESLLTGESVSVHKMTKTDRLDGKETCGDDLPLVFSGTLVVQGGGVAKVVKIGAETEIGKIGKSLERLREEVTPLQIQIRHLVQTFAISGGVLCLFVAVVYGYSRYNWMEGLLAGLSLAMAMLPEEFPVVFTIFLALGAWRLSKQRVLTRRIPAVETLGAATVLCVDKTGTLTLNQMRVSHLFANGQSFGIAPLCQHLPESFHELVEYGILACPLHSYDPMDKAIQALGIASLIDAEHLHSQWTLSHEYPLSRELLAMSNVWRASAGNDYVIAAKGAPEAIADLCHFSAAQLASLIDEIDVLGKQGARVIGVARARFAEADFPAIQHDFQFEFLGLLGLEDPIRPGAADSIQECYQAGIRTIMITGDYPQTAQFVGAQLGISDFDAVITGPQLNDLTDRDLRERIRHTSIFARMVPEQKLRLIQALQHNGDVVAMTGDGVNDAPALKAAHIGIAMGGRGTDVAREAAALVLLDDDFSSIVQAVRRGRQIYDNLRKAMMYIFSVHIPIAGLSLLPVLFKWPLVLFPIHIVFLELIIDPACSVAFEAERGEADILKRPPRPFDEPLFTRKAILMSVMQGVLLLAVCIGIYFYFMGHRDSYYARSLTFVSLVVGNLGLILTNRSYHQSIFRLTRVPNKAFWVISAVTLMILGVIFCVPFLVRLFQFGGVFSLVDLMICLVATAGAIGCMDLLKKFY